MESVSKPRLGKNFTRMDHNSDHVAKVSVESKYIAPKVLELVFATLVLYLQKWSLVLSYKKSAK